LNWITKEEHKSDLNKIYKSLSIINDIMVGIEFLIGSILFLPGNNTTFGVYLFILGSSQLLIRPFIEIARKIHLFLIDKK